MKVEATLHGDRKVYSVSAFNRGIGSWLARLPTLWVEGEITELRRQDGWQSVFFTLKDLEDGSCLPVVHAPGDVRRPSAGARRRRQGPRLRPAGALRGARRLSAARALARAARARRGARPHRAAEEDAGRRRALRGRAEAAPAAPPPADRAPHRQRGRREARLPHRRHRPLPGRPRARRGDVRAGRQGARGDRRDALGARGASPRSTSSSSPAAAAASRTCSRSATSASCVRWPPARCRWSPPSATSRTRRSATSPPTPAPRPRRRGAPRRPRRARAAGRPRPAPDGARPRHAQDRWSAAASRSQTDAQRLTRAPALLLERKRARLDALAGRLRALSPRATLERGYAIVSTEAGIVRSARAAAPGTRIDVELAEGGLGARVEETRE